MVDRWNDGLMDYAIEKRKPSEGLQRKRLKTRKKGDRGSREGKILNEATVKRTEKKKRK